MKHVDELLFLLATCYRFISIRGGNPISTVNCASPRSCKTVWGGRAAFPARRWSCLQCCALKQVTTWPLSSMAVQILLGSSLTAWLTEMVCIKDTCYDTTRQIVRKAGYSFYQEHCLHKYTMFISHCKTLF